MKIFKEILAEGIDKDVAQAEFNLGLKSAKKVRREHLQKELSGAQQNLVGWL